MEKENLADFISKKREMFLVQVNTNPTVTVLGVVHNTDLASYYPYGLTKVIRRCDCFLIDKISIRWCFPIGLQYI